MAYEVEYLDDAFDVLTIMPTWLREVTHRHWEELAKSPFDDEETTKLPREGDFSRRSGFSHGPVEGKYITSTCITMHSPPNRSFSCGVFGTRKRMPRMLGIGISTSLTQRAAPIR